MLSPSSSSSSSSSTTSSSPPPTSSFPPTSKAASSITSSINPTSTRKKKAAIRKEISPSYRSKGLASKYPLSTKSSQLTIYIQIINREAYNSYYS